MVIADPDGRFLRVVDGERCDEPIERHLRIPDRPVSGEHRRQLS